MRTRLLVLVSLAACGSPPPTTDAPAVVETTWTRVAVAGVLEVSVRDRLGEHEGASGMVFRLTNHGDEPVLADLRSLDRVVRPDAPRALRLPLSDAQVAELSEISALSQVAAGGSATYAVPYAPSACEGTRTVPVGGTLVALDRGRTIELVADGADAVVACAPAAPMPSEARWVAMPGALAAAGTDAASFPAGFPELIRAASITHEAQVALLPFAYDPRPVERWRYDACVAAGTCPERTTAQPPGSIRAPAVGMSTAGVDAFCAARALRGASAEELAAIGDPGRALLATDAPDVVASGFRCARSEAEAPPAP